MFFVIKSKDSSGKMFFYHQSINKNRRNFKKEFIENINLINNSGALSATYEQIISTIDYFSGTYLADITYYPA